MKCKTFDKSFSSTLNKGTKFMFSDFIINGLLLINDLYPHTVKVPLVQLSEGLSGKDNKWPFSHSITGG